MWVLMVSGAVVLAVLFRFVTGVLGINVSAVGSFTRRVVASVAQAPKPGPHLPVADVLRSIGVIAEIVASSGCVSNRSL